MAIADDKKQRLEALRLEQAKWQEQDKERGELEELEELENEATLRALVAELEQKHGPRWKLWDIVDTKMGPIAFKCGEGVSYAKFLDATNSDTGLQLADMQDFILPNLIHPPRDKYAAMCTVHAAIPVNIWPLLARLYRGVKERAQGK
jgi:hypothetical protein